MLQPGNADLEELIEVGRHDRKELHPFQQRHAGVERPVQHALVELEPGQLTVQQDVPADRQRSAVARRLADRVSWVGSCVAWMAQHASTASLIQTRTKITFL